MLAAFDRGQPRIAKNDGVCADVVSCQITTNKEEKTMNSTTLNITLAPVPGAGASATVWPIFPGAACAVAAAFWTTRRQRPSMIPRVLAAARKRQ